MIKPYVGISCLTSNTDAQKVAFYFIENGFSRENGIYQGALGYAITWEILRKNKNQGTRYITASQIPKVMVSKQTFGVNVLHFVPEPNNHEQFIDDIKTLFLKSDIYRSGLCRTLQLNYGTSLHAVGVSTVKTLFPNLQIIFQIGSSDFADHSLPTLIKTLSQYSKYVDMFLIDPSQGQGKSFEVEKLRDTINSIQSHFPNVALGFAGGLTSDNLKENIKAFKQMTNSHFSFDTESGVRNKQNDRLDLKKVQIFIKLTSIILKNLHQ